MAPGATWWGGCYPYHLDHAAGWVDAAGWFRPPCTSTRRGAAHPDRFGTAGRTAVGADGDLLDSLYVRLTPHPVERRTCSPTGKASTSAGPHPHHRRSRRARRRSCCTQLRTADPSSPRMLLGPCPWGSRDPPPLLPISTWTRPSPRSGKFGLRTPAARPGPLRPDGRPPRGARRREATLRRWAEVAEKAFQAGEDITAAPRSETDVLDHVAPEHRAKLETSTSTTPPGCAAGGRPPGRTRAPDLR